MRCETTNGLGDCAHRSTSGIRNLSEDGLRKIIIKDQQAFMEQLAPTYQSSDAWGAFGVVLQDVLSSIGLHTNDLIVGCEPMLVNTG
jgi:hypothetical protein